MLLAGKSLVIKVCSSSKRKFNNSKTCRQICRVELLSVSFFSKLKQPFIQIFVFIQVFELFIIYNLPKTIYILIQAKAIISDLFLEYHLRMK
jgi:hypothetical protein